MSKKQPVNIREVYASISLLIAFAVIVFVLVLAGNGVNLSSNKAKTGISHY
jgi:uncharacterized membrane protein (DUF441 family)